MQRRLILDSITYLNHNVVHLSTQKPSGYEFVPGQASDLAIANEQWKDEKRPFTFTSLPKEKALEFVIKIYPDHNGMTEQLPAIEPGNGLLLGQPRGAISYKGAGTFIAGGAGVTPFIPILKNLADKNELGGNTLLFANKKKKDIFYKEHFSKWLNDQFINILSEEKTEEYHHGRIDLEFLKEHVTDVNQFFYVCGPPKMTKDIVGHLKEMGVKADKLVHEAWS